MRWYWHGSPTSYKTARCPVDGAPLNKTMRFAIGRWEKADVVTLVGEGRKRVLALIAPSRITALVAGTRHRSALHPSRAEVVAKRRQERAEVAFKRVGGVP
jgi:hypothetical protein